jgi:hypothetical protein
MFPVGRRLAFDGHTGRLWVVCRRCGHWNLSPLEERWEALGLCEQLYQSSRVKASTDNIGITALREGLQLIRIGKPLRPEFSAWRYGPRIVARRKKAALVAVGGVAATAVGSVAVIGASIGAAALVFWAGTGGLAIARAGAVLAERLYEHRKYERVVARVTGMNGHRYTMRQKHLRLISIEPDSGATGWRLALHHESGLLSLTGAQATLTAGQLLAKMNAKGASKASVALAANRISEAGGAQQFIQNAIALRDSRRRKGLLMYDESYDSFGLRYEERLAVEMAMHEDAERQALEDELSALEQAWRDAEEIGAIADRMFVK